MAPVLSPLLTKALGCGCVEDGGGREKQRGWREKLVSHRIVGWDVLEGASSLGCKGTLHTHSLTHSLFHTHTLSVGDSGASCWPRLLQMIQG